MENLYTITVQEAATFYRMGENEVYRLCKKYGAGVPSGKNKRPPFVLKIGRKILIKKALFEEFVEPMYCLA